MKTSLGKNWRLSLRKLDLTGERFGRLTVISAAPNIGIKTAWHCACDCGGKKTVKTHHLRTGGIASCGCLQREPTNLSHGLTRNKSRPPEYTIWAGMKDRCLNPNNKAWKHYGYRNISVCPAWINDFGKFLSDMGKRPSKCHTIERIDNNGNYEPSNCRWATYTEQARNRRNTRFVVYQGKEMSVAEMAEISGIPAPTIYNRLNGNRNPVTGAADVQ